MSKEIRNYFRDSHEQALLLILTYCDFSFNFNFTQELARTF